MSEGRTALASHFAVERVIASGPMATSEELKRFIAACEPGSPAGRAYVERTPSLHDRLDSTIEHTPQGRVLLLGQTGVGKSTEMERYAKKIRKRFLALRPPLDTGLDLGQTSWHEILLFTLAWSVADGGPQPDALMPILQQLRVESAERLCDLLRHQPEVLQPVWAQQRTAIWELCCGMLQNLQRDQPVVLLWDGLEKLPAQEQGRKLFYTEGRFLQDLPCRAVITGPLGLSFEAYFDDVQARFSGVERLRAVPKSQLAIFFHAVLSERGFLQAGVGTANIVRAFQGQNVLNEVLTRSIQAGGGLPRQTLQILAQATKQALQAGVDSVLPEHVAIAIRRTSERFRYQLGPEHLAALRQPQSQLAPSMKNHLLQLTALIEYEEATPEGVVSVELNPLVADLVAGQATQ